MERDEIICMAREAGWGGDAAGAWADGYEAGAAAEREACAKEANSPMVCNDCSSTIAAAIRARGQA